MRVLVVDGDPCIRQLAIDCLEDKGIQVWSASTGPAMMQVLDQQSIDLLVLDVDLPDIDSRVLLREVYKNSNLPIVFLTARNQEAAQSHTNMPFVSTCLAKPFSPSELLGKVSEMVQQNGLRQPVSNALPQLLAYRFAGWELNLRTRRLFAPNGAIVVLTQIEFGLLAGLLAHSDEFLSRNRLVSVASLPVPDDEQETALSLHVEGLRKKINPLDSSTNFIVHEPHLGYRFTIRPEARFA